MLDERKTPLDSVIELKIDDSLLVRNYSFNFFIKKAIRRYIIG
jgi:hypothetical protein